jgi:amino acid permease
MSALRACHHRRVNGLAKSMFLFTSSDYSRHMGREVRPGRFELPKAARIVLWIIAIFFALWFLLAVVSVVFFPDLYR